MTPHWHALKSEWEKTRFLTPDQVDQLFRELEKAAQKNDVLSHHVAELTEEIENVKSDFGGENFR